MAKTSNAPAGDLPDNLSGAIRDSGRDRVFELLEFRRGFSNLCLLPRGRQRRLRNPSLNASVKGNICVFSLL